MLNHWLIDLFGHVSGLSDAQLRQIEKSLPATKALIDLLNTAQPIIDQAQSLYAEAEPLIDQAKKEWQTVGPAAQILIDVISHHVDQGSSPAEAAEAVRTALGGSIKSVAQDHWVDRDLRCVTVCFARQKCNLSLVQLAFATAKPSCSNSLLFALDGLAMNLEKGYRPAGDFIIEDADYQSAGIPSLCVEVCPTFYRDWTILVLVMTVHDMSRAVAALIGAVVDFPQ
jgi:hypothetical protein